MYENTKLLWLKWMEWKSGISQILRGMAEKRRKCGIIPPKSGMVGMSVEVTDIRYLSQSLTWLHVALTPPEMTLWRVALKTLPRCLLPCSHYQRPNDRHSLAPPPPRCWLHISASAPRTQSCPRPECPACLPTHLPLLWKRRTSLWTLLRASTLYVQNRNLNAHVTLTSTQQQCRTIYHFPALHFNYSYLIMSSKHFSTHSFFLLTGKFSSITQGRARSEKKTLDNCFYTNFYRCQYPSWHWKWAVDRAKQIWHQLNRTKYR